MIRGALMAPLVITLSGCGQTYEEKRAEALAAEPRIGAGVYSDIQGSSDRGDVTGIELRLADGSDSQHVDFIICNARCQRPSRYAVRRGLGGVSFAHQGHAQVTDITVQPDGADAVMVSADWGAGLEQRRLPRVSHEFAATMPPGVPASR
jgi:hypothetical protein